MKIGYISFRLAGTDGVSLEAVRWKDILERMGHEVVFVSGDQVPTLHFLHPEIENLHRRLIDLGHKFGELEGEIEEQVKFLKNQLRDELVKHNFDRLIVANVFSLPIHLSAAQALIELILELEIPTVSRNHDFWWERQKYMRADCKEYFGKYFVFGSKYLQHVTINSLAQAELKSRQGIESLVIGDCFDFESSQCQLDEYNSNFRADFGIRKTDKIFLQATRIVPRKRIELAMELVSRLEDSNIVLVLAGYDGDETGGYGERLKHVARAFGIRALFIGDRIESGRRMDEGKRIYTLWDCLANCDLMTYPSEWEGFGNQFIEGVYAKKPIFVNRYPVYVSDIEPLGFDVFSIDGVVTDDAVEQVRNMHIDVEKNFEIGKRHFSYEATQKKLEKLGF